MTMSRLHTCLMAMLAANCLATAPLAAKPAPLPPPFEGFYQPQGVDEIGWWSEDDESESDLDALWY